MKVERSESERSYDSRDELWIGESPSVTTKQGTISTHIVHYLR